MPKYSESPAQCLENYLGHLQRRGLVPRTISSYREDILRGLRNLEELGRDIHPARLKQKDIEIMLDAMRKRGIKLQTQKRYIQPLKGYLRYYGNNTLDKMDLYWPSSPDRNVDWLSPQEAQKLLDAVETPLQEFVIHCELCLGMRRIEVLRMKESNFDGTTILIQGKGRGGAQWRTLPYHPDTAAVLGRWLEHRQMLVRKYLKYRPNGKIPEDLLIFTRGRSMSMKIDSYARKGTGLDKAILIPLRKKTGMHFANHTLRRTFARTLWLHGVKVETIAALLGHHSTEVTLKYIGVQHSDMSSALTTLPFNNGYEKRSVKM